MTDLVIALIGVVTLGAVLGNKKVQENFGLLPSMTVNVQKEYSIQPKHDTQANTYSGPMMAVPPNYQAALQPRPYGIQPLGATIQYNLPANQYLASPDNPLTYGSSDIDRMSAQGIPSCAQGKLTENYDDPEKFEAISQMAPRNFEKAQALADMGVVKSNNQPIKDIQTQNGPASVVVYDRLMYSNTRSSLYGQGDPIRGDIGCIVPIRDGWFRPSVVPNRDLRQGALAMMGGVDNDTNRQLRALQDVYSAGVSKETTDAYAYSVNPITAQKSISISGGKGAEQDIVATAFP